MTLPRPVLAHLVLNIAVSIWILLALNAGFWGRVVQVFPAPHLLLPFALAILALTVLHLEMFAPGPLQKPVAAALILISASAAYYERNFGVVINREMVRNIFETTSAESRHLITGTMLIQVGLTGVLPALLVFWPRVRRVRARHQIWRWPLGVALCLVVAVGAMVPNMGSYLSALRANPVLMSDFLPGAPVSATLNYARDQWSSAVVTVTPLGEDAAPGPRLAAADRPVLLVVFAGETLRAQNFGLNGYARDTTPGLRQRAVINYPQVESCGTSTAVSLPCMFSRLTRETYSRRDFLQNESLLDVLAHAGLAVEWYDNNTGDQNIARRTGWSVVDASLDPEDCTVECTDSVFLPLIDQVLAGIDRNTVLVLHMIGNHGPAYYLRDAPERALFQPQCRTTQFSDCSLEEIVNAYDNAVLETDHVLSGAIDRLAAQDRALAAMLFVSDHGESLGENGLFLHAAPMFMAPEAQTHVPMVLWLGEGFRAAMGLDTDCLTRRALEPTSHDALFHTILGLLDVVTEVHDPALDLTEGCRIPQVAR